jgi:hypothetical protein
MEEKDKEKEQAKEKNINIEEVTIENEMQTSYLDYSMSVIIGRAIPDIRDGLKPVHRRTLFSMHQTGSHYNQAYKKSARIVGDVMGKYHPHGDAAIYDTVVRMARRPGELRLHRRRLAGGHALYRGPAAEDRQRDAQRPGQEHGRFHTQL